MPISQDRLSILISAGEHIEQTYLWLASEMASVASRLEATSLSPFEAIVEIRRLTIRPDMLINQQSTAIQLERLHYRLTWRKNEKDKERKANRRAGIPPKEASPTARRTRHQPRRAEPLPPPRLEAPPEGQGENESRSNLAWDETDPENAFASGDFPLVTAPEALPAPLKLPPFQGLSLSIQRQIELDSCNAEGPEHRSRVEAGATAAEDRIVCACGFEGLFEAWREHLVAAAEVKE